MPTRNETIVLINALSRIRDLATEIYSASPHSSANVDPDNAAMNAEGIVEVVRLLAEALDIELSAPEGTQPSA